MFFNRELPPTSTMPIPSPIVPFGDLKPIRKRKPKWCKNCGRKHSKGDCQLKRVEDLTVQHEVNAVYAEDGHLIKGIRGTKPIGYYSLSGEKTQTKRKKS